MYFLSSYRALEYLFYNKVTSQNAMSSLSDNQEKEHTYGMTALSVSTRISDFIPWITLGFPNIRFHQPGQWTKWCSSGLDEKGWALGEDDLSSRRVCLTKRMLTEAQKQSEKSRTKDGNAASCIICPTAVLARPLFFVSLAPLEQKTKSKWLKLGQPFSHFRMWAKDSLGHFILRCAWKHSDHCRHNDSPFKKGAGIVSFCCSVSLLFFCLP